MLNISSACETAENSTPNKTQCPTEIYVNLDVLEAVKEMHRDVCHYKWLLTGFIDNDLTKPLAIIETGDGLLENIQNIVNYGNILYILYKTKYQNTSKLIALTW